MNNTNLTIDSPEIVRITYRAFSTRQCDEMERNKGIRVAGYTIAWLKDNTPVILTTHVSRRSKIMPNFTPHNGYRLCNF